MNELRAGAGKSEILFSEEMLPVEGFCGIHDNPYVRILCIEKEIRFAAVAIEMVMLPDELIDECKNMIAEKLHIPKKHIWIHVTHAITTPHCPGGPFIGPGGEVRSVSDEWKDRAKLDVPRILKQREYYLDSIRTAVGRACDNVRFSEARIRISRGTCVLNQNRDVETVRGWWTGRGGAGYSNKKMTVIRFEDTEGGSIASVVSYGIKPCVIDNSWMREGKRQISADVTGAACRLAEEELGTPVLFFMAAAGNQIPCRTVLFDEISEDGRISTRDLGVNLGFSYVDALGKRMSEDILRIAGSADSEEVQGELSYHFETFSWPGMARGRVEPTKKIQYVQEGEKQIPIGVLTVGTKFAMICTKPEINAETERKLQEQSEAEYTLLVTMVDGGMKYMPDRESFEKITWEAMNSMLMPGAAEKFTDVVLKHISNDRHKKLG